jgi:hypothetical protein
VSDTVEFLKMFAGFPGGLRNFLRDSMTPERARAIVRARMAHREENFLRIAQDCIYANPRSPYLKLLRHAGCEIGDLRALVADKGLEGALAELHDAGVYVRFQEFKGREPIVRNGLTLEVTPRDFDNLHARRAFAAQTGGSSGHANTVYLDLDYVAAGAVTYLLTLESHSALNLPVLQWMPILPGAGIHFVLQMLYLGHSVEGWYTSTGWFQAREWLKFSGAMFLIMACLAAARAPVPFPRLLRHTDAVVFARRVRQVLDREGGCLIQSGTSLAVRACAAAEEAGFDLAGAIFRVGGEPLTPAKASVIQGRGARVLVHYGSVDAGSIGLSCADPVFVDDVHLNTSVYAMISQPQTLAESGVTVPILVLTQLLSNAPKVLLNYQSDDYAVASERVCGCVLGELGMTGHLSEIRSYSKLVGESVTLAGNEMVRILEQVLPARFGGTPLDYQIVEQEDTRGLTRIALVIHPKIDLPADDAVLDVVLDALSNSSASADAARVIWEQAKTFHIERRAPILTPRGKQLPLHIRGRSNR